MKNEAAPGADAAARASDGEDLCASAELDDKGRAIVFDVLEYGRPMRAFALRFDGRVFAYLNRCAHVPTELDWNPGEFLDADREFILCSTHGAAYEPKTGRCAGGPCGRGKLMPIVTAEREGRVYWYPSRDIQPLRFDDDVASDPAPSQPEPPTPRT